MAVATSPLRYPGGKQILANALSKIVELNDLEGKTYLEPYAGGAGAALSLLYSEHVSCIRLNDADPAIYAFWKAILDHTDEFISRVRQIPLEVEQWKRQRAIYNSPKDHSILELGFATFYLNRCNRSGIIANAGVIGGLNQQGNWKIDARFNRSDLERRISRVALYSERITVHNLDAIDFLDSFANASEFQDHNFVYLDPPYFDKGSQLYLNYYSTDDHRLLSSYLKGRAEFSWVMTYDDTGFIRSLYEELRITPISLRYSAGPSREGNEVLISKAEIALPKSWMESGLLA